MKIDEQDNEIKIELLLIGNFVCNRNVFHQVAQTYEIVKSVFNADFKTSKFKQKVIPDEKI